MSVQEFVKNSQSAHVRWTGQQVLSLAPKKRVECVQAVCDFRLILADEKSVVEPIPDVLWIAVIDARRAAGFFEIRKRGACFPKHDQQQKK